MNYLLFLALSLFRLAGSFGLEASTNFGLSDEVRSPNCGFTNEETYVPTSISVTWAKKRLSTESANWYTCEGTAKVITTGSATKFDWQIMNLTTGGVELQKFGIGKTWVLGYIEPLNDYQIQVRESGASDWFSKPMSVPTGCGIK
jgi:hypothetical protein